MKLKLSAALAKKTTPANASPQTPIPTLDKSNFGNPIFDFIRCLTPLDLIASNLWLNQDGNR